MRTFYDTFPSYLAYLPCSPLLPNPPQWYFQNSAEVQIEWRDISLPKKILQNITVHHQVPNPRHNHTQQHLQRILPKYHIEGHCCPEPYQRYWSPIDGPDDCRGLTFHQRFPALRYCTDHYPGQWSTAGFAYLTLASLHRMSNMGRARRLLSHIWDESSIPTFQDILDYLQTYFDSVEQNVVMFVFDINSPYNARISITPSTQIHFPLIQNGSRELFFVRRFGYMLHITPMGIHVINTRETHSFPPFFYKYQRDSKMDWNQMCKEKYKMSLSDLVKDEEKRVTTCTYETDHDAKKFIDTKKCIPGDDFLDKQWIQEEKWSMLPKLIEDNMGCYERGNLSWPIHYIPAKDIKKVLVYREDYQTHIVIEKIDHEWILFGAHIYGFFLPSTEHVQRVEEDGAIITNKRTILKQFFWPHKDNGRPIRKRYTVNAEIWAIQMYSTN